MRAPRGPDPAPLRKQDDDGFTLLESLIALSVAAILAVGLIRFSAGTQVVSAHADRRLAVALLEANVAASLPDPGKLTTFSRTGSRSGLDWSLSAAALRSAGPGAGGRGKPPDGQGEAEGQSIWQPYRVTLTVSIGGNVVDRVEMIRLGRARGDDT